MPRKASKPATTSYVPVPPAADQKYLPVRQAAAYIGSTISFVRHQLIYGKAVPWVRLGQRVVFDRADLDAYMAARKAAA